MKNKDKFLMKLRGELDNKKEDVIYGGVNFSELEKRLFICDKGKEKQLGLKKGKLIKV